MCVRIGKKRQEEIKRIVRDKIVETLNKENESIPHDLWLDMATDIFLDWIKENSISPKKLELHLEVKYDSILQESNLMILSRDNKNGIAVRKIEKQNNIPYNDYVYNLEGKILARQESYYD